MDDPMPDHKIKFPVRECGHGDIAIEDRDGTTIMSTTLTSHQLRPEIIHRLNSHDALVAQLKALEWSDTDPDGYSGIPSETDIGGGACVACPVCRGINPGHCCAEGSLDSDVGHKEDCLLHLLLKVETT